MFSDWDTVCVASTEKPSVEMLTVLVTEGETVLLNVKVIVYDVPSSKSIRLVFVLVILLLPAFGILVLSLVFL